MKPRIIILASVIFFISNLVLAADPGPPKEKKWKGKGEVIEFQSMPILTVKDFLNGKAVGINIARAGRVSTYALPSSLVIPLIETMKQAAEKNNQDDSNSQ